MPDDEGVMVAVRLLLGHRRLSIIDLENGKQRLSNEDKSVWVSFNGEIYIFKELRPGLVQRGHMFWTRTGSDVLVHMYEDYGIEFIHKLHGWFEGGFSAYAHDILTSRRLKKGVISITAQL